MVDQVGGVQCSERAIFDRYVAAYDWRRYFAAFASAPRMALRMLPLMMPWISSAV